MGAVEAKERRILGLVPARQGSKGVPFKNIKPLCGRPLLSYTAEAARRSGVLDRVLLSTDSEEIARVGREWGLEVPFLRPHKFASDDAPMLAVISHAVEFLASEGWSPDIVVLLQPTSPLRQPECIRQAVSLLVETGCDSAIGVAPVPLPLCPDYVMKIQEGRLTHFLPEGRSVRRRQDVRPAWFRDGSVYAFWRRTLASGDFYGSDSRPVIISTEHSLSIDSMEDWREAERRLAATGVADGY